MERPNDVHYHGVKFAQVPHGLIEDVKNAKAIALYAILAKFADWSTGESHPSKKKLARLMGYATEKAVNEALEVLTQLGWVETFSRWIVKDEYDRSQIVYRKPTGKGWEQTSNGYVIYQQPRPPRGAYPPPYSDPPPSPSGGTPPSLQGGTPPPYRDDKQEPIEQQPVEREPKSGQAALDHTGDSQTALLIAEECNDGRSSPEAQFDEWWVKYPRKVNKKAARTAFLRALKDGVRMEQLHEGLDRSIRSWAREGRPKDKMPHGATWLNGARWEDEETLPADVMERPVQRQPTANDVAQQMIQRMRQDPAGGGWKELGQ